MPVPGLRPRPGHLRAAAEEIERATGLPVEIVGGKLVMSPPQRGKHAGTVKRLLRHLTSRLPEEFDAYAGAAVAFYDDPDDYRTPDLVVLPRVWEEDDDWFVDPADVELAVEVVPAAEKAKDVSAPGGWYAAAHVRLLLVLDPRGGTWVLHTHPEWGMYQGVLRGRYGDGVPLPAPFTEPLDTARLPLYGETGAETGPGT